MSESDREGTDLEWEQIDYNLGNARERAINDYSHHWKGVISETIQNSYDGWCTNRFVRDIIPEDQELVIGIGIDTERNRFEAKDNAGGMPADIFESNYAGLDTPSEEKEAGGTGGNYGRGFHVVAGLGKRTEAETRHGDYHQGIIVEGTKQAVREPFGRMERDGTQLDIINCKEDVIDKLSDWEKFTSIFESDSNRYLSTRTSH